MQVSDKGLEMIAQFEGFRERAYQDRVGVWTVGYGETRLDGRPVRAGDTLMQPEASARLKLRVDRDFGPSVQASVFPVTLTPNRFDACVSLCYNIGCEAFRTSTLVRRIKQLDFEGATEALTWFDKAGGHVDAGLVARRKHEAAVFSEGY